MTQEAANKIFLQTWLEKKRQGDTFSEKQELFIINTPNFI